MRWLISIYQASWMLSFYRSHYPQFAKIVNLWGFVRKVFVICSYLSNVIDSHVCINIELKVDFMNESYCDKIGCKTTRINKIQIARCFDWATSRLGKIMDRITGSNVKVIVWDFMLLYWHYPLLYIKYVTDDFTSFDIVCYLLFVGKNYAGSAAW